MNFKPELVEKILAGEKTQTRRVVSDNERSPWYRGGCSLKVGKSYAVCPGRGKNAVARVKVLEVKQHPLVLTLDEEARAEGFEDAGAFFDYFAALNGPFPPELSVWAITFELVVA